MLMSATSMSTFFNSPNTMLDCGFLVSLAIGEVVDMLDCCSRLVIIESDAEDDASALKFLIDFVLANSAVSYVLPSFSFSFASILFGEITRVTSTFLDSIVIFFSAAFASSSFRFCALCSWLLLSNSFSSFLSGDAKLFIVS